VLMTLPAAYPVYRSVAQQSADGQGSMPMLERLLPKWKGKRFVLILLGFAATDFINTMTRSFCVVSVRPSGSPSCSSQLTFL